jgi:hypothetical protein
MEKRIGSTINPLTVKDLCADLNLQFERLHMGEDDNNSTDGEKLLNAVQFKGRCHSCGKYGHKEADCRNKTSNGSNDRYKGTVKMNGKCGGFKGNCNYCNKYGHKAADYFIKKKEQGKELASNAIDSKKHNEVILPALEPEDLKDYKDQEDYKDLADAEWTI